MKTLICAAVLALVGSAVIAPSGFGQELTADELIDGLDGFVKKKNDEHAVGVLGEMADRFAQITPADQKKVLKAVSKCLTRKRPDDDNELYVAAVQAMGKMGEGGGKAITKSLRGASVKKRPAVLAAALRALGEQKLEDHVETLIDYLVNSNVSVVAATAEGLGNYGGSPEKLRKKIVQELVKTYAGYHSLAVSRPKEVVFGQRLGQVERPIQASLTALTGQKFENSPDWERWYNKNKKTRWDKDKDKDGKG